MKQDVPTTKPREPATAATSNEPRRSLTVSDSTAIEALSTAADSYGQDTRTTPPGGRRLSFGFCIVTALLAGVVLAFAGRFDHPCSASLRVSATEARFGFPGFQHTLVEFMPERTAMLAEAGVRPGGWFVDAPSSDLLRLSILASSRSNGLDMVRRIGAAYEDHIRSLADTVRQSPSPTEESISTTISTLEERLSLQQGKVDEVMLLVSGDDPSSERAKLLQQWKSLRDEFSETRGHLKEAAKEATALRTEMEPTQGLVGTEERRQALEADSALQQDLRELAVNLTELKQHMLIAWQGSIDPLKTLATAADNLIRQLKSDQMNILWATQKSDNQPEHHPLVSHAQTYRDSLTTFLEHWTQEFATTQSLDVDPYEGKILDAFERARHELNDFLFRGAKQLASMRSAIRLIASSPMDSAQFHVAQAGLTRAFQATQTAHHRFEFAGSAIDTVSNFRIDAASRAARGLRRRTQARIKTVDRVLQQTATKTAKSQRTRAIGEADRRIAKIRLAADEAVDELLTLQDKLHLRAEQAAEFLQHSMMLGLATARVDLTRDYLERARNRLKELTVKRMASANAMKAELIGCDAPDWPTNLLERVGFGALGVVLVFAATWLGQRRLSTSV